MTIHYSETQLDALREIANIGSGTAATSLAQMLGRPINVSVPTALALPLADAVESIGPPDTEATGIVIPVVGDLEAIVLLVFTPSEAMGLCDLLGVPFDSEIGISALGEIGNILGASYIGALAMLAGLALEPRPPEAAVDMLGAIVSTALVAGMHTTDLALVLDSKLEIEGEECSFAFVFVPDVAGVTELLTRLGVDG